MLLPALLEATDESARRTRDLDWQAASVAIVIVAVVAFAALLFAIMKPTLHQSVVSPTLFEITGSTSHSNQGGVDAPAADWTAPPTLPPSQAANDEQPQQLLQRLLQWREKAINTETSQ
jgi:hypothetical protein